MKQLVTLVLPLILVMMIVGSSQTTKFRNRINKPNEKGHLQTSVQRPRDIYVDFFDVKKRQIACSIHPLLATRHSVREMCGRAVSRGDLMALFEAARWTPSAFNQQPWRFVYAHRGNTHFDQWLEILPEDNRQWATGASVLILVVSTRYEVYKNKTLPNEYHDFDTGAAWMSMAIEANARGLALTPMGKFDTNHMAKVIGLEPHWHNILVMLALGQPVERPRYKLTRRFPIEAFTSENKFAEKIYEFY